MFVILRFRKGKLFQSILRQSFEKQLGMADHRGFISIASFTLVCTDANLGNPATTRLMTN